VEQSTPIPDVAALGALVPVEFVDVPLPVVVVVEVSVITVGGPLVISTLDTPLGIPVPSLEFETGIPVVTATGENVGTGTTGHGDGSQVMDVAQSQYPPGS
jgi:hypothetical protein